MESSRLPGKSLMHLGGRAIVDWVALRAASSDMTDAVVFAVPDTPTSDVLAAHLRSVGQTVVRGSEDDVLSRFVEAAAAMDADVIVRTCADRPLVSGEIVDATVTHFLSQHDADLTFSHRPWGDAAWDYGFGVEVLSAETLRELDDRAVERRHREHVTLLLYDEDPGRVQPTAVPARLRGLMYGGRRFDVDDAADLERLVLLLGDAPHDIGVGEVLRRASAVSP
jgi:spore coat polysaccharide biosynthesis protein SpsF